MSFSKMVDHADLLVLLLLNVYTLLREASANARARKSRKKSKLLTLALLDTSLHVLTLVLELMLALQVSQEARGWGGVVASC